MNTTLQIRIDSKDKKDAQKIFKDLGMDITTGIKTFIRQVVINKALPFQPRTENGFTPEYEAMLLRESAWAEKHAKRYKNAEDMFKDLEK
ncbi:MAG: type II toxin-antitoxin system RelB/DinJ family antitoxin [Candidatus Paceibacterota bacterium]|jgi:DNA-damage-inducible protein J